MSFNMDKSRKAACLVYGIVCLMLICITTVVSTSETDQLQLSMNEKIVTLDIDNDSGGGDIIHQLKTGYFPLYNFAELDGVDMNQLIHDVTDFMNDCFSQAMAAQVRIHHHYQQMMNDAERELTAESTTDQRLSKLRAAWDETYIAVKQSQILILKLHQCARLARNEPISDTACPWTWDGVACWSPAAPETVVNLTCPIYVNNAVFSYHGHLFKYCERSGSWHIDPQNALHTTDLFDCMTAEPRNPAIAQDFRAKMWGFEAIKQAKAKRELFAPSLMHFRRITLVGNTVSLVFLVPAVIVFSLFERLHTAHNHLHLHLLISFLMRATFALIKCYYIDADGADRDRNPLDSLGSNVTRIDADALIDYPDLMARLRDMGNGDLYYKLDSLNGISYPWSCKLFMVVWHYTIMVNYCWILMEAAFIGYVIYFGSFRSKPTNWPFVIAGWVTPMPIALVWSAVRYYREDLGCWNTAGNETIAWIVCAPIAIFILLSLAILLHVAAELGVFDGQHVKSRPSYGTVPSWMRSILMLATLAGAHYATFFIVHLFVYGTNTRAELYWLYVECFTSSLSGALVAFVLCFANQEVRKELSRFW